MPIVRANIAAEAHVMTDEARHYTRQLGKDFASHETVNHSDRRVRVAATFTPTPLRASISIFKRGMKGIYQHCKEKHLHRYLAEFDFRYSNRVALGVNDVARAERALKGHRRQAL